MPVVVAGKNARGQEFNQSSETTIVNAHGGLLHLNEPIEMGAVITLMNVATREEQKCRVVFLGDASEKGRDVGIEFLAPAPQFWAIEFPPADWSARAQSAFVN